MSLLTLVASGAAAALAWYILWGMLRVLHLPRTRNLMASEQRSTTTLLGSQTCPQIRRSWSSSPAPSSPSSRSSRCSGGSHLNSDPRPKLTHAFTQLHRRDWSKQAVHQGVLGARLGRVPPDTRGWRRVPLRRILGQDEELRIHGRPGQQAQLRAEPQALGEGRRDRRCRCRRLHHAL